MNAAPRSRAVRPPSTRRRRRIGSAILWIVVALVSLGWAVPILSTLVTSFRTFEDVSANGVSGLPQSFTLENFVTVWTTGRLSQYLLTSMVVTLPALAIILVLSSMAAFVLAGRHVPFARTLLVIFLAGNLLPPQMLIVPVFELSDGLGIYDSKVGLIAINAAFQLGFAVFVLYNFMRTVPADIFEAAEIDGAGRWRQYTSIMLPVMRPALAAVGTLQFTWIFNDYLWAVVLVRSDENLPVTAGLMSLRGEYVTAWPTISAGAVLAAIPVMIVFFLLQRQFVSGLMLGSVK